MEIINALKYVFSEPGWVKKLLIPGVIALIPFAGFIYLLGWSLSLARNLKTGTWPALPEPLSLSYLTDGIRCVISLVVYLIPLGIIRLCDLGLGKLVDKLLPDKIDSFFVKAFGFFFSCVSTAYILIILLVLPILLSILIRENSIRGTFDFRHVYQSAKDNSRELLPLMAELCVLLTLAGSGASFLLIGIIFTLPYALSVYMKLYASSGL